MNDTPAFYGPEKEAGFTAVRHEHGELMTERMRNWPILAENYARAQYALEETVQLDIEKARGALARAKEDKDFALAQARAIAAKIPRREWTRVPSVSQLQAEWGFNFPIVRDGFQQPSQAEVHEFVAGFVEGLAERHEERGEQQSLDGAIEYFRAMVPLSGQAGNLTVPDGRVAKATWVLGGPPCGACGAETGHDGGNLWYCRDDGWVTDRVSSGRKESNR